jgi:exosortase/archaeosortase family protein
MASPIQRISSDKKLISAAVFVAKVLGAYLLWKILLFFFTQPGTGMNRWWIAFADWFAYKTIQPAAHILKLLGYSLVYNHRNIIISNTQGMFLADHCLGISVCVIFMVFIAAYKGKWQHKLWYIPLGLFCIYAINVIRLVGLGIVQVCCADYFFELAHTRIYLLMSYGMFFLLIVLWMNRLARK